MARQLVEEIDKRTYDPNIYYTSADPHTRSFRGKKQKNSSNSSTFRSVKRVNYSLADLEAKLYMSQDNAKSQQDNHIAKGATKYVRDRFSQQQIMQSKRRFMELNTENLGDLSEIPTLLSSSTGINRDKINSDTTTVSQGSSDSSSRSSRNKFEIPKSILLSYKSTKPLKPKKKSTNRIVALRKVLVSKRPLHTYFDMLSHVDKSVILHNVYNKKYFKVLPLITVCSICGGYDSISSCVKCGDKVCSLKCYNLHNEARCTHS
ncbi:similar to Saccharomyces cerevisiae YML041C VPS71 Nucleosome-binding component of the SWR1 complex, which exchanges histone variant H2AZ (Htz1p) for chromatin-bound histone H2A [Maudiozyma saulgeensis]|uniref:Similar to Saccharomyces cerevisiae YML041C VPS71 Nucleosome-binding component of the SWR1 complex, which exchanges histone variant H2AZ (Htz1p) for chromatin-bound histone H2A n=1 Tax=Maudiozyma saulgeensis TaxID=1789683 RepID=A0A1X7QXS2_9SACH|nr:similar to Saccharomyces cerevisiae YML041C VPS71 Nucleosome-binding component of the SWR1 complex, which exchanges histone variant H2AZ (Htz1p) for chromatin-bound histone H2A [Kazachstania saulgeensis]